MSDKIICWKCGKPLEELPRSLPFREDCPHCGHDLHCCVNCKFYSLGKPNNCLVPGTEFVANRERFNFCEEFSLKGEKRTEGANLSDVAKKLFGDN